MQISELAAASGIPLATVKFYLREGLLPKGEPTSATRAEYDESHLRRLRLIGSLAQIPGLPLAKMREILGIIDRWEDFGTTEAMGTAVTALPPYPGTSQAGASDASADMAVPHYGHAEPTVKSLGLTFDPSYSATQQLDTAIHAVIDAGLDWSPEIALRYGTALAQVARAELAPVAAMEPQQAVEYAVLGTALYEPVIIALRRLLHREIAERDFDAESSPPASA